MAKHKPKHQGVADRARHDRAFLKKALANPGLRSKLDVLELPRDAPAARDEHAAERADHPGLEHDRARPRERRQAATDCSVRPAGAFQLGQQLGIAQQTERDTGSFYDQYLADLAQHAANVAAFQQAPSRRWRRPRQGITGLSGAQGAALQQQANQAAAQQGVTPAGNLAPMLSDAAAIRQALIGSVPGSAGDAGREREHVRGHAGERGRAGAEARRAGAGRGPHAGCAQADPDLKAEEGAFNQQFRDTRRQDEFKNVLAQQTLGRERRAGPGAGRVARRTLRRAQTR
jgi:hypothetical protein